MSIRVALSVVLITTVTLVAVGHSQEPASPSPLDKARTTTEIVTGGAPILTSIPSAMTTIANYYRQPVYDPMDKKIGEIADVLIDKDGKIEVLIVSVGGFLGIASKDVAVPFKAIQPIQKNGSWYLTMNATIEALKSAPGYRYDKGTASWVPA
jgi:sporulation protein YlmC with PRC-barrel domain